MLTPTIPPDFNPESQYDYGPPHEGHRGENGECSECGWPICNHLSDEPWPEEGPWGYGCNLTDGHLPPHRNTFANLEWTDEDNRARPTKGQSC